MIIITSKKDGFRRCGIAHPATTTEYPDDRFTEEELEVLRKEPMLVVLEAAEAEAGSPATPTAARAKIAFISKVAILEELEKLVEGETRKAVLDAIAARRQELEA